MHNILLVDYLFNNLVFSFVKLDDTGYLEEEYATFSIFCPSKSQIPILIKKGIKHIMSQFKDNTALLKTAKLILCERLFKSNMYTAYSENIQDAISEFYDKYNYTDWTVIDSIPMTQKIYLVYASRDWFNLLHSNLQDFNLEISYPVSFPRIYNSIITDTDTAICLLDIANICIGYKQENELILKYIKHSMFSELKIKKQKDFILKANSQISDKITTQNLIYKRLKRIFDAVVRSGFEKLIFTSFLTKENTELILKDLQSEIIELDKIGLIHKGLTDMMNQEKDLYTAQYD